MDAKERLFKEQIKLKVKSWMFGRRRGFQEYELVSFILNLFGDLFAHRIVAEGLLAPEWVNAEDKPSPINACIRAAKRVIAALNLPEGAGVAMESDGSWWAFQNTAELRLIDDNEWWDGNGDELP